MPKRERTARTVVFSDAISNDLIAAVLVIQSRANTGNVVPFPGPVPPKKAMHDRRTKKAA